MMTEYEFYKEATELLEEIECTKDDIKSIDKMEVNKGVTITVCDIPIPFTTDIKKSIIASLTDKIDDSQLELNELKKSWNER